MNKIAAALIIVFVFAVSFLVPISAQTPPAAGSISENQIGDQVVPVLQDSEPTAEDIQYDLPYPGIMLNHPLYFLKNIRDRIIEFFITDDYRRTEFYLLQSDKFMSMALAYFDQKQTDLAATALTRVVDQKQKALVILEKTAPAQNTWTDSALEKNIRSVSRHIFLLKNISPEPVKNHDVLRSTDGEMQNIQARLQNMKTKRFEMQD